MKLQFLLLVTILLASCRPKDTQSGEGAAAIKLIDSYPELTDRINKTENTPGGNFFRLVLSSDSTCKVEWGNTSKTRTSSDLHFHIARKLEFVLENKDFLVLEAGTGSDTWFDLILPLSYDSTEFSIQNPLAFNTGGTEVVCEYPSADTVMVIENLLTRNIQFVLEKEKCSSFFVHYCVDTVVLTNKELYYKWAVPNTEDKSPKYFERRVKIRI